MGPERPLFGRLLLAVLVLLPGCFSLSLWDTGVRRQLVVDVQFWRADQELVLVYGLVWFGDTDPIDPVPHWASIPLDRLYARNESAAFQTHRGMVPPELFARMEPIPPISESPNGLRLSTGDCLAYRTPVEGDLYLLRDSCENHEARFRLPAQNEDVREAWAYPVVAVGAPFACVLDIVTSPVQICLFGYVLGEASAVFGKGAAGTE